MNAIIFFVLALSAATSVSGLPKLYVDPDRNGHFIDDLGRVRILRGINSVYKGDPWFESQMLDPAFHTRLAKEGGFNVVRLGSMWTGLEPERGQIDQNYINTLKSLMAMSESEGMYSLLDMHQDALWQHGKNDDQGGYWGVPPYIKHSVELSDNVTFPWPMDQTGFPWFCAYITEEVSKGFQDIFSNVSGTRDRFHNIWREIAAAFHNTNGLLGYELMNEPWAGDVIQDASLMLPGVTGRKNLAPMYEETHAAIRSVDDETLLFWEPVTWAYWFPLRTNPAFDAVLTEILSKLSVADFMPVVNAICGTGRDDSSNADLEELIRDLGTLVKLAQSKIWDKYAPQPQLVNPPVFGPGFTQVPGGENYLNRTVFSWHYYCPIIGYGGNDVPMPPEVKAFCDDFLAPMVFESVDMWSGDLGGQSSPRTSARMLTEFGICVPDINNPGSTNTVECEFMTNESDRMLESWTFWNYHDMFDKSTWEFKPNVAKFFVRAYPSATYGTPHTLSFDVYHAVFDYSFYPSTDDLSIPTEIFLPEMHYPGASFHVEVSSDLRWEQTDTGINVYATASSSSAALSTVRVVPLSRSRP